MKGRIQLTPSADQVTTPTRGWSAQVLTRGSRLARNSVLNLLGQGVPFLAAVIAIPLLIRGLGTARFGVLTLAWIVIGYFSLFDFGLGRALTQVVAEGISADRDTVASPVVWAALALMLALGLVGTLVMSLTAPWLVHSVLKIPGPLQVETLNAFYLLAAAIPIVVVTAGLAGILSAFQRFGVLNAIRAPMGIYTFVAPLAVLPFSQSLVWVTTVLGVGRLLACGAYFWACRGVMPPLRGGLLRQYEAIRPLFRFGAWMTVSNVVSPLMQYLDRFVIGAMLSMAAVAYYSTPYEAVTKVLIVPGAILSVLFPAFAASYRQDRGRMVRLYTRGTKYITLILFPGMLLVTAFACEGLRFWLGDEFARHSAPVLQILAIGVFANGIAQVFATLVQGVGRPDLSAKLHLLELPIYLPLLWWAIHRFGILGAAMVWTGRVVVDGAVLFWLASRFLGDNPTLVRRMTLGLLAALAGLAVPLLATDTVYRAATVLAVVVAFVRTAWVTVLDEEERMLIRGRMGWAVASSP
jgi:O-antigen/teichoic acid export membrane protein